MIGNIKELRALLKLCRAQGVTEITLGGNVIKFGDMPKGESANESDDEDEVPTDALSPEQLMFFSSPNAEGTQ